MHIKSQPETQLCGCPSWLLVAMRDHRRALARLPHPCIKHTEPGSEMFKLEDGTEVEVTDELREQWERDGVTCVMQIVYVGTCYTNGCKGER